MLVAPPIQYLSLGINFCGFRGHVITTNIYTRKFKYTAKNGEVNVI